MRAKCSNSAPPDGLISRTSWPRKRFNTELATTLVTESFYKESARAVAARLLARTGLPVAGVDIPDAELPHQVFSRVPVARALKQLETSLTRAFGADFR